MRPRTDLFLSYHRADRRSVDVIRRLLAARGVSVFLDIENLVAGRPWPVALEEALSSAKAVAVCLGREIGGWQKREIGFALDRQVHEEKAGREFPVIPLLLPQADLSPSFLFLNTWIDLRTDPGSPEGIDAIERALTTARPETAQLPAESICPYRGLRPFREEDAAFFVGRESFVERLQESVLSRNLVALIGSSGSGKSSVAQAGLVPLLRRQRPPARTWDCAVLAPGKQPFHSLGSALLPMIEPGLEDKLARLEKSQELGTKLAEGKIRLSSAVKLAIEESKGTDRLLLIVDQFEELFTLAAEEQRAPFIKELLAAAEDSPVTLLLTLRADFYGHVIAASRELSDLLERSVINLGPMRRDELERAIVRPARLVGLDFEEGLTRGLLDDAGDEPGNLPLLEFALTQLWQASRRKGNLLTHQGYEEIGRLTGAIARRADAEFGRLSPEQQEIAPRLLTRLVRVALPGEGGQDTRRVADTADLSPPEKEVIRRLADANLLITGRDAATGQPTAQVAHEALIRSWKRLADWVSEDRQFLLWRQRLAARVADLSLKFSANGKYLTTLSKSGVARAWDAASGREVITVEQVSPGQHSVTISADGQRLAVAGWRGLARVFELESRREVARMIHPSNINSVGFGPDAQTLITASDDTTARIWRTEHGREIKIKHETTAFLDARLGMAFSPDGTLLATSALTARTWDPANGSEMARVSADENEEAVDGFDPSSASLYRRVAFSPDGRVLAFTRRDQIVLADAATGRLVRRLLHPFKEGAQVPAPTGGNLFSGLAASDSCNVVVAFAFSPDGRRLASAAQDGTTRLWDTSAGEPCRLEHSGGRAALAFSPDGKLLARAAADGVVVLVEAQTGRESARLDHQDTVFDVAFSPAGNMLACAGGDDAAWLWGLDSDQQLKLAHGGAVTIVRFSRDGGVLVTGSADGTVRAWDPTNGTQSVTLEQEGPVTGLALSPDGRYVAAISSDRAVRIWDLNRRSELARLNQTSLPAAVKFSPDGKLLAVCASFGGEVTLWRWRPEDLIGEACSRLTRDLTDEEWRRYFADAPYRKTRETADL